MFVIVVACRIHARGISRLGIEEVSSLGPQDSLSGQYGVEVDKRSRDKISGGTTGE